MPRGKSELGLGGGGRIGYGMCGDEKQGFVVFLLRSIIHLHFHLSFWDWLSSVILGVDVVQ